MTREGLIAALSEAAELEHGITCQYLFAAFSLKVHPDEGGVDWPRLERIRAWKAELLRIARQEMMHHGLVCNLLLAIGGAPRFGRTAFPLRVRFCAPHPALELLPFSGEALSRFASYERAAENGPDSIDSLYREIRDGLARVYRTNPRLFIGPLEHQLANQELGIRQGQFDMELSKVTGIESALALIDRIRAHDHESRIMDIQRELGEGLQADPDFRPARPVVANPRFGASGEQGTALRHPHARAAAELFNRAYEVMLLMLERLYGRADESDSEASALLRGAFFPMMTTVIRPLGELLTQMPASEDGSERAGPCFETTSGLPLPPARRAAWLVLHERLLEVAEAGTGLLARLRASREPWVEPLLPRFTLLSENLERIAMNFAEHLGLGREYVQQLLRKFS